MIQKEHFAAIEEILGRHLMAGHADFYHLLGLESSALEPEIRKALKASAAIWTNSNRNNHPESALITASLLKKAQAILLSPEQKQKYDSGLTTRLPSCPVSSSPNAPHFATDSIFPTANPFEPFDPSRLLVTRSVVLAEFGSPEERMAELARKMPSLRMQTKTIQNQPKSISESTSTSTSSSATARIERMRKTRQQRKLITLAVLSLVAILFVGFAGFQFLTSQSGPKSPSSIAAADPTSTRSDHVPPNSGVLTTEGERSGPIISSLPKLNRGDSEQEDAPEVMATDGSMLPMAIPKLEPTLGPAMQPTLQPTMPPADNKPLSAESMPAQADALVWKQAMTNARAAIEKADFDSFHQSMQKAIESSTTPQQKEKRARLDQMGQLYQIFLSAIKEAKGKTRGTEAITVGNNLVNLVEVGETVLVVRIKGENTRYPWDRLPTGIALALADLTLDSKNPTDLAARAVYLSLSPTKNELSAKKAKDLFQQSVGKGEILKDLPQALTDSYE